MNTSSHNSNSWWTSGVSQSRWGVIGCGIVLIMCVCAFVGFNLLSSIGRGQAEVEEVIDGYMEDMSDRRTDLAIERFVSRLDRNEIREQFETINYAYFDGYRSLQVNAFRVGPRITTNPLEAQGTVATVNGTMRYTENYTGTFEAILEQDGDRWLIFFINVNVPDEKLENYESKE
jgi:hypothetical protein